MGDLDGRHRVQGLVTRPAVYVRPDEPLRRVAEVLSDEAIGSVLVRGPEGTALGLVSERDIVRAVGEGADVGETRADEVMAEELVTVARRDELLDAVTTMLEAEVRHLPVVEDGVHYGVVSARDALRALAEEARERDG